MARRDVTVKRVRFAVRAPASLAASLLASTILLSGCQPYPGERGYDRGFDRSFQPYAQSSVTPYPALPPDYRPQQALAAAPPPHAGNSVRPAGADPQMLALSSLAKCQESYRAQQWVDAVTACNAAIDISPNLADAYDERANAFTWLRDYERAIDDYGTVLKLRPSYFFAYNNRGNAFAALGEFDRAIADYSTAIRVRPDYAEAYGNRGSAYAAKTDYQRAVGDFDMALKLKPDYERAQASREQALQRLASLPITPNIGPDARADAPQNLMPPDAVVPPPSFADAASPPPPPPPLGERAPPLPPTLSERAPPLPPLTDPDGAPIPLAAPQAPLGLSPLPIAPPPLATLPEPPAPEPGPVPLVGRPQTPSQPQPMPFTPGTHVVSGSGVVIDDGRHIITNRHVVESVGALYARNGTGYLRPARILAMSNEDDLALLEIDKPFDDRCAIPLAKLQNPAPGRPVIVMGFPLRSILGDDHPSMTEGIVSKAEGFANDHRTFQITNKINPGNSGGPVFDRRGRLMGVIVGKMPNTDSSEPIGADLEGLNLGIKADRILRFLQGRAGAIAVADDEASADEDIYREMLPCVVLVAGEKVDKSVDKGKGKVEQKMAATPPRPADPNPAHVLRLPPNYVPPPATPEGGIEMRQERRL
jgi:S1-C subfamily serine protease/tetratricopeptide (TPR) repeat protein